MSFTKSENEEQEHLNSLTNLENIDLTNSKERLKR
jgi:hypothetical protein